MYFVYILICSDGSFYTGITNNLKNRLVMHELGKGSKYVRSRLPFKLVYTEKYPNKSSALKREACIKRFSKFQKEELIKVERDSRAFAPVCADEASRLRVKEIDSRI